MYRPRDVFVGRLEVRRWLEYAPMTRVLVIVVVALAAQTVQQSPGTFPAMQRKAADAQTIARGKAVFGVNCVACHVADARGGQLNGPNLLRSQLVLADQERGELLTSVIQGNGHRGQVMPALPLGADDARGSRRIHPQSHRGESRTGLPPLHAERPPPDIVRRRRRGGTRGYFAAKCSACHSADGDHRGIAGKVADAKVLQNPVGLGRRDRARAARAAVTSPPLPS